MTADCDMYIAIKSSEPVILKTPAFLILLCVLYAYCVLHIFELMQYNRKVVLCEVWYVWSIVYIFGSLGSVDLIWWLEMQK